MNPEIGGIKPVRRPRTRWKDVIRRNLASSGPSMEQAAFESRNRDILEECRAGFMRLQRRGKLSQK